MARVVRINDGERTVCVLASDRVEARLCRFAALGVPLGTLLRSDRGPLLLGPSPKQQDDSLVNRALAAIKGNSIRLSLTEEISFGKKEGAKDYQEFADISLSDRAPGIGLPFHMRDVRDGEIVNTVWPGSKRVIPAKVIEGKKRVLLELAESQEKGKRCFVLNEPCTAILTASLPSNGSDRVLAIHPMAFGSWLEMANATASRGRSDRFDLELGIDGFTIVDKKRSKKYSGKFYSGVESDNLGVEILNIERLLFSRGLGAILPVYKLKTVTGE
jgi:hypothetical protein